MLDKAVISRVQGRFKIDGARTVNDFLDQDYLWWSKLEEAMPNFVNMTHPLNYKYLKDQGLAKRMGDILSTVEKPTEERILDIYDQVEATHKAEGHAFFALLFKEIQKYFPFSRQGMFVISSRQSLYD